MKAGDNIFVYGTLKTGHGANSILQGRSEYQGDGRISATMYNMGAYPAIKTVGNSPKAGEPIPFVSEGPTVHGEVWRITDEQLPALLDRYEGYPYLYNRRRVQTDGGAVAWTYEYADPRIDPNYNPLIPTGRWG